MFIAVPMQTRTFNPVQETAAVGSPFCAAVRLAGWHKMGYSSVNIYLKDTLEVEAGMTRINTTHFAILGLLRIKPMSAYELVKFSKESIGLFWNESYGHIHKSLQHLEREGSVSVVEATTTGRQKKVYGITPQGCGQLDAWLTQAPEEPVMRNELLMKIFVADDRHIPRLIAYLEAERAESQMLLDMLAGIKAMVAQAEGKQARLWLLTLDYGERYVRMTSEWCEHALRVLNQPDKGDERHDE